MRRLLVTLLMLAVCAVSAMAADIKVIAEVNKKEIEFGDRIEYTISIKKAVTSSNKPVTQNINGFSFSFNSMSFSSSNDDDLTIQIDSIPGFEILGRRSSQQSRIVNGKGESTKLLTLTLVPEKVGEFTIPAYSMKDSDGEEHSSEPIKVVVHPAAEDPEEETPATTTEDDKEETKNHQPPMNKESDYSRKFNSFIAVGLVFIFFVMAIMVISHIMASKSSKRAKYNDNDEVSDAEIVSEKITPAILETPKEYIDFNKELEKLKAKTSDYNQNFYKSLYELFKKACCSKSPSITDDMTYSEALNKISGLANTKNIKEATNRLNSEIEIVMYANMLPNRNYSSIESDLKEIINSL